MGCGEMDVGGGSQKRVGVGLMGRGILLTSKHSPAYISAKRSAARTALTFWDTRL